MYDVKNLTEEHIYETEFKMSWGYGEWIEEPDRVFFTYQGMECCVNRNNLGNLCGYVKLKEGHPWENCNFDETGADVHGGVTFLGKHDDIGPGVWVGFDCAHSYDLIPGIQVSVKKFREDFKDIFSWCDKLPSLYKLDGTYKNIQYVMEETKNLAAQVKLAVCKGESNEKPS